MTNLIFEKLQKKYLIFKNLEAKLTENINLKNTIKINIEYTSLKKELIDYIQLLNINEEIDKTKIMLNDTCEKIRLLAKNELNELENKAKKIKIKIIASETKSEDKKHIKKVFFEIRSATGGNESSIFAKNLAKMYLLYFDSKKWKYEVTSCSHNNYGYKEIIIQIHNECAFSKLKYESGIHRVQRVPDTESNGRIHTSTCTIAVLPEMEQIKSITINQNDIRIDTYRASGAGGQHVNMTDSAVRITHLPTGIVAECQSERSQHKNKHTAMELLKLRLLNLKKTEIKSNIDTKRKNLVGSGERCEKIRTYNFVQNRVTDHRMNLTIYRLNDILNGNIDLIIDKLINEYDKKINNTI